MPRLLPAERPARGSLVLNLPLKQSQVWFGFFVYCIFFLSQGAGLGPASVVPRGERGLAARPALRRRARSVPGGGSPPHAAGKRLESCRPPARQETCPVTSRGRWQRWRRRWSGAERAAVAAGGAFRSLRGQLEAQQARVFTAAFEAAARGVRLPSAAGERRAEAKGGREWLSPVSSVLGQTTPAILRSPALDTAAAAGVIGGVLYCLYMFYM